MPTPINSLVTLPVNNLEDNIPHCLLHLSQVRLLNTIKPTDYTLCDSYLIQTNAVGDLLRAMEQT